MNTLTFGWETGNIQNSNLEAFWGPTPSDLTVVGYQLDVSMQTDPGHILGIGDAPTSQVLLMLAFTPAKPAGWVGGKSIAALTSVQLSGVNKAEMHGTPLISGGVFVSSITKITPPGAVNRFLTKDNLSIHVLAGSYLLLNAGHSGVAADFEVQGVLFVQ